MSLLSIFLQAQPGGGGNMMIIMGVMMVGFFLLIILPQQRKQKKEKIFQENFKKLSRLSERLFSKLIFDEPNPGL